MSLIDEVRLKHSNSKPVPEPWRELVSRYLAHLRAGGYPETTIDTRRQHLHFLARRIGKEPIRLTAERLEEWCSEQEWRPETRRGRNNTYRFFWRWGARVGELADIAKDLPTVRQRHHVPRVAPEKVYRDALQSADERTGLILRLAAECGLRRGEIAVIHTGRDLFQDHLGWTLIVHGKGDKQRLVPLPTSLGVEISRLESGWAFPGSVQGHLSVEWVGRLAARVLGEQWTLHTLRAYFATKTYLIDHDVFAVQELLGHSSPETTRRYVRTDSSRLRRLVEIAAS